MYSSAFAVPLAIAVADVYSVHGVVAPAIPSLESNMRSRTLFVAALTIVAAGTLLLPARSENDKNALDLKKLQGTWRVAEGEKKEITMTFTGKKFILNGGDDGPYAEGTIAIDASKTPKTMDLTVEKGKGEVAEKFIGKTSRAIYDVTADSFKWCANEPGREERPSEFVRQAGERRFLLITFKREK